jgi:FtsZ-binding cell division protein ZapB
MALEENARGISNALDSERTRTTQLEAELSEARRSRDRLEAENQELKAQQEKAVRLSLSLKTEERLRPILTRPTQDSFGAPNYVHVSEMTLLIYNHGERPVAPRGCKIWKLHATEATQELPIHGVVTSAAPMPVDITVPLLHAISGNKPIDFASLQGKCSLRIVVAYSEGSVHKDAEPRDFELSCKPWRGGMTLRIEAIEVTSEQS